MHAVLEKYRGHLMKLLPENPILSPLETPGSETETRQRLQRVGQVFMQGCWLALEADTQEDLVFLFQKVDPELLGFAFEGAGMGLAIIDYLTQGKMQRLQRLVRGAGKAHSDMVYVGAGLALARLHQPVEAFLAKSDPISGWFTLDGYGFHEGFFRNRFAYPELLSGQALRVFDAGLGRSIWFKYAGEGEQIVAAIADLEDSRHSDLWGGVGLASAYAGIVERTALEKLRVLAGPYASSVAQGIAFAARIRQTAGNIAPHTELAAQVFCRTSAEGAAHAANLALENLSASDSDSAFEVWRQRLRQHFAEK